MFNLRSGMVALLLIATSASVRGSVISDANKFPDKVVPGTSFTLAGNFDPAKKDAVFNVYVVGTDSTDDKNRLEVFSGAVSADGKSITATLPRDLHLGRYYLTLNYQGATEQVPGELRVVPDAVQLDSAHPTTAYKSPNEGFDFDVVGQNFSSHLEDDDVIVSGQGSIIRSRAGPDNLDCNNPAKGQPCLWIDPPDGDKPPDKLHVVGYHAEHYQGPINFSVEVGGVRSAEKALVLSRMSETGVLFTSVALFLVLALIIYQLVARGMRDVVIDGSRYSPFWSFFIDKETNSYSLSKFQLLAFSCVFVFGYLYVFLCSWLVQWHFVLPDVPTNFSAILAMSAGTTVAAAGATSARGSKGAGRLRPSAADFITTGGQVVPERFQFFVWTLVACFGFLALLVSQDPATLVAFPTFPNGLLYVMGVSAGGYLGGKLTRPAGPVLRSIAWDTSKKGTADGAGTTMGVLTVLGDNLSSEGDFLIDGKMLPIVPNKDPNVKLVEGTPQDQASDKSFCSQLKITVKDVAGVDLSSGAHVFRIVNKDAQFADIRFTVDPPAITRVAMAEPTRAPKPPFDGDPNKSLAHGTDKVLVSVTGSGFALGTTARWTAADSKDPVEIPASDVKYLDDEHVNVSLVVGNPGSGTLLLQTPNGFSAVATITVV